MPKQEKKIVSNKIISSDLQQSNISKELSSSSRQKREKWFWSQSQINSLKKDQIVISKTNNLFVLNNHISSQKRKIWRTQLQKFNTDKKKIVNNNQPDQSNLKLLNRREKWWLLKVQSRNFVKRDIKSKQKTVGYKKKILNKYKQRRIKKNFERILKKLKRIRKTFKRKHHLLNYKYQQLIGLKINSLKKFSIRVTSNNIFCTLSNVKQNKITLLGSSGKYSIKTSRKRLRYSLKTIVHSFLEELKKKKLSTKRVLINIIAPLRLRKAILKLLTPFLKKKNVIINAQDKKCFNGCRPPKKKRKKRKGLRLFK